MLLAHPSSATTTTMLVIGLNAAFQKRCVLDTPLIPGEVHRIGRRGQVTIGIGGKGQDVAVSLHCLQSSSRAHLVQFVGSGPEGDQVMEMFDELLQEQHPGATKTTSSSSAEEGGAVTCTDTLQLTTIRTESRLRTCTSLVAPDTTTELVEPSGTVLPHEFDRLLQDISTVSSTKNIESITFMGSLPPGCPPDTYSQIYRTVVSSSKDSSSSSIKCLVDSVNGLSDLLTTILQHQSSSLPDSADPQRLQNPSTILKINSSEMCRLANVPYNAGGGAVALDDLILAIKEFLRNNNRLAWKTLAALCITDGPHPAYMAVLPLVSNEKEFRLFQLPIANLKEGDHPPTLYPIGAGDSVAAGTIAAWQTLTTSDSPCLPPVLQDLLKGNKSPSSRMLLTAFSFGLACGAASCRMEENSVLTVADVIELYQKEGRPIFLSSHIL